MTLLTTAPFAIFMDLIMILYTLWVISLSDKNGKLSQFSHVAHSEEVPQRKITEVSRKVIERIDIAGSDEELRLMLVEFPSAFSNVAHTHPVAGLCYVVEGTAESQYEGEDVKTFHAGDSYQDSATKKHLIFRNASKTDGLKFTCAVKIKKDQQFMLPL